MTKYCFILLLIFNPLTYISDINQSQLDALKAYQEGEFLYSIIKYRYLTDSLGLENENIYFNLAHAYYKNKNWEDAKSYYDKMLQSKKNQSQSISLSQLGILSDITNRKQQALDYFKRAIQKYPLNFEARYNYELLKKRLKEQEKQQKKQDDKKDEEKKKQENKSNNQNVDENDQGKEKDTKQKGNGEAERMNQKQANPNGKEKKTQSVKSNEGEVGKNMQAEDFKKMDLNLEKANMILDAMKNQEIQYLQQKKKQGNTQDENKDKPDW